MDIASSDVNIDNVVKTVTVDTSEVVPPVLFYNLIWAKLNFT